MENKTQEALELLEQLTGLVKTETGEAALTRIKDALRVTNLTQFQTDDEWADTWFRNNLPGLHPDTLTDKGPIPDVIINGLNTFTHINDEYAKAVEELAKCNWETTDDNERGMIEELALIPLSYIVVAIFTDYNSSHSILGVLEKALVVF